MISVKCWRWKNALHEWRRSGTNRRRWCDITFSGRLGCSHGGVDTLRHITMVQETTTPCVDWCSGTETNLELLEHTWALQIGSCDSDRRRPVADRSCLLYGSWCCEAHNWRLTYALHHGRLWCMNSRSWRGVWGGGAGCDSLRTEEVRVPHKRK